MHRGGVGRGICGLGRRTRRHHATRLTARVCHKTLQARTGEARAIVLLTVRAARVTAV